MDYLHVKKGHSFLHILSITIGVTSFIFRMLLMGKGLGVKAGKVVSNRGESRYNVGQRSSVKRSWSQVIM